jgi:hypothetical protein
MAPIWSISRYDKIMKAGLDHATYSSAAHLGGITIRDSPTGKAVTSFIGMDQPTHKGLRQGRCPHCRAQ